jgi:hypothetical protein
VVDYFRQIININIKSRCPKTDPWSTPDRTTKGEENKPEKPTQDSLFVE